MFEFSTPVDINNNYLERDNNHDAVMRSGCAPVHIVSPIYLYSYNMYKTCSYTRIASHIFSILVQKTSAPTIEWRRMSYIIDTVNHRRITMMMMMIIIGRYCLVIWTSVDPAGEGTVSGLSCVQHGSIKTNTTIVWLYIVGVPIYTVFGELLNNVIIILRLSDFGTKYKVLCQSDSNFRFSPRICVSIY